MFFSGLIFLSSISRESLRNTVCFQKPPSTTTCAFSCCKVNLCIQNEKDDNSNLRIIRFLLLCGLTTEKPTPSSNEVPVSLLLVILTESSFKITSMTLYVYKRNSIRRMCALLLQSQPKYVYIDKCVQDVLCNELEIRNKGSYGLSVSLILLKTFKICTRHS